MDRGLADGRGPERPEQRGGRPARAAGPLAAAQEVGDAQNPVPLGEVSVGDGAMRARPGRIEGTPQGDLRRHVRDPVEIGPAALAEGAQRGAEIGEPGAGAEGGGQAEGHVEAGEQRGRRRRQKLLDEMRRRADGPRHLDVPAPAGQRRPRGPAALRPGAPVGMQQPAEGGVFTPRY